MPLMPDALMGAMPPAQDQGGPPPELLAALMSGAGAGDVGAGPPGAAPPDAGPPSDQGTSALDHLRQAIEHAQQALMLEPDDEDSRKLARAVQMFYEVLAERQREERQVMGNPATQRVLKRSYGS